MAAQNTTTSLTTAVAQVVQNVPSNDTVNEVLDSAEDALEQTKQEEKRYLTPQGTELINQTETLIRDARNFVNEKNRNEILQDLLREGEQVLLDLQQNQEKWADLQKAFDSLSSEQLAQKMSSLSTTAKLISIELLTSSTFRQSIYDFFSLLYAELIDISQIEKVGKPLREIFEDVKIEGKEAIKNEETRDQIQQVGEKALELTLDAMDPEKPLVTFTQEQKDALWNKFNKIMKDLSKRERSQRVIQGIFEIFDLFTKPLVALADSAQETAKDAVGDEHLYRLLYLAQQLCEAFTRRSLDSFLAQVKVLYSSITEDKELVKYFSTARKFILDLLEKPEKLLEKNFRIETEELLETGRTLIEKKKGLRHNFNIMRRELNSIILSIEQDPSTNALQQDITKLLETVFLDEQGKITFKPEVLDQLRIIALSAVVKRLRFPLPPLTFDDHENLRFTVTGLVLNISELLPEQLIAENHGIAIVNMQNIENPAVAKATESVRISMKGIKVHMPEADIWFQKRSFPAVTDSGKAKIDIAGKGMDLTFILRAAMGTNRLFVLETVECVIHDLTLKLGQTHHDTMYNAMITIFKGFVKRNIEEAIQESMANVFENLNDQIEAQVAILRTKLPQGIDVAATAQALTGVTSAETAAAITATKT